MRWGGWLGKGGRRTMFFVLLPCIFNHKMIILDDCTPPRRGGVQASSIIINNPKGIKFIARLQLGLSHLRNHELKHRFQDSLNPLCNCGLDVESNAHYLLHCPTYTTERRTLLSTIENIDSNFIDIPEPVLIEILFFGSNSIDANANTHVLNAIYLLKDLKNRSFNEVNKFSNKVMNQ